MAARIRLTESISEPRNSVGGAPVLPRGAYPRCAHCKEKMVLFVQLDLPVDHVGPELAGHLVVFMCPTHNEALLHPDYRPRTKEVRLSEAWWNDRALWHVHFAILARGTEEKVHAPDPTLAARGVELEAFDDAPADFEGKNFQRGAQGFKVGGYPWWRQFAHSYVCSCGAPMRFILQVPADYVFEKQASAPAQPNGSDPKGYVLTLGNTVYMFACTARCHPRAVWAINQ